MELLTLIFAAMFGFLLAWREVRNWLAWLLSWASATLLGWFFGVIIEIALTGTIAATTETLTQIVLSYSVYGIIGIIAGALIHWIAAQLSRI